MIAQQRSNGRATATSRATEFEEIGTSGLEVWSGYVQMAYNAALYWPTCEPLYSRIWRSDPETAIVRQLWAALAGKLTLSWELPETDTEPNDADRRAADFANSTLEDMAGGAGQWLQGAITRVPFYGFGVWERLGGVRRPNWAAPEDDGWRSQYDDGLVGIRRLAWRDYSAFDHWEIDDRSGRMSGMWQNDPPNPPVMLPVDRLLHITYGDHDNPEGLATMEALWRLERLLYNKEIIQGIGFNHTAGHLSVTVEEGQVDNSFVNRAARAIMSPQEGNYAAWPKGVNGEILDSAFSAAGDLEVSIQNTRILKLALYGMQFVAISTMSGSGSYAALDDSSSLAMLIFNSIAAGLVQQADDQIGRWLFEHPVNAAAFRGMTRRPRLTVSQVAKDISLTELGQFAQAMAAVMPLGDDDLIAIRTASGILPEELPEEEEPPMPEPEPEMEPEMEPEPEPDMEPGEPAEEPETPPELAEMAAGDKATRRQVEDDNDEYEEAVAGLILAAQDGDIGRAEFTRQADELTEKWLLDAFKLGAGIPAGGRLTATQRAALAGQMEKQREANERLAAEIFSAGDGGAGDGDAE